MSTIIDITRAHKGSERRVVEAVLERHAEELAGHPIVLGFESQAFPLGAVTAVVDFRSAGSWQPEAEVNRIIAETLESFRDRGLPAPYRVFSFHHLVINRQGRLGEVDSGTFEVRPLRDYTYSRAAAPSEEWPEELIPLSDAVVMLERALTRAGATPTKAILKSDIRHMLVAEDPRFRKDAHPAAANSHFISALVDRARAQGIIKTAGYGSKVSLWPASADIESVSSAVDRQLAASPSEMPRQVRGGQPPTGADRAGAPKERDRSQVFTDAMRRTNFGPFPEVRTDFYRQLMEVSAQITTEPFTARYLCRESAERVKAKAPEGFLRRGRDGVEDSYFPKERYAWDKLQTFGMRALARAGLLHDKDGNLMPELPFALPQALITAPLPDDLDVQLDAEVVLEVLKSVELEWASERADLAGVLFSAREEQALDRLDQVISHLHGLQKVHYDPDRDVLRRVP
ncbi:MULTISPECIES: hypothetical protein [Streptomyces]|uniref:hypothetical protein n=1 Tax=Streptomyces TaxID=1883 RepID=UPI000FDCA0D4|nr:hypothetical protein [Streptomyces sp. S10(2018)]